MAAREVPPAAKDQAAAPSPAKQETKTALATAQTEATAALSDLVAPQGPAVAADAGPAFDLARIEDTGEAVIAGRAAPGATVELLRDGQPLDQAVADASGQFVMVPQHLPAGKYELTLRSKAPDGTITLSSRGVPVALNEAAPSAVQPRADATPATRREVAASPLSEAHAAVPASDAGPVQPKPATADTTGAIAGKPSTRVVVRGDSLWLISRHTYGDGARYALIYKANRALIHDPNRIFPGQTFVLPMKAR